MTVTEAFTIIENCSRDPRVCAAVEYLRMAYAETAVRAQALQAHLKEMELEHTRERALRAAHLSGGVHDAVIVEEE